MNDHKFHDALLGANHLAARGNYEAAAVMLEDLGESEGSLQARLLEAKIAAQQSKFEEAIRIWEEVLVVDPNNEEARKGIDAAREMKDGPGGTFYLRSRLYYGLLMVCIVALSSLVVLAGRSGVDEKNAALTLIESQEEFFRDSRETVESLRSGMAEFCARSEASIKELRSQMGDEFRKLAKAQHIPDAQQIVSPIDQRLAGMESQHRDAMDQIAGLATAFDRSTGSIEERLASLASGLAESLSEMNHTITRKTDALRNEVGWVLYLSPEVRALTAVCGELGDSFWSTNEEQRQRAREGLKELVTNVDRIVAIVTSSGREPESASTP